MCKDTHCSRDLSHGTVLSGLRPARGGVLPAAVRLLCMG
jgi:hypothetical protein